MRKETIIEYKKSLYRQVEDERSRRRMLNVSHDRINQLYPIDIPKRLESRQRAATHLKKVMKAELDRQLIEHAARRKKEMNDKKQELMSTNISSQAYAEEQEDQKTYSQHKM